tara:strand:- start:4833 stop:5228 length:396 start_codon:yes stop_codon:yes gene_type:complete
MTGLVLRPRHDWEERRHEATIVADVLEDLLGFGMAEDQLIYDTKRAEFVRSTEFRGCRGGRVDGAGRITPNAEVSRDANGFEVEDGILATKNNGQYRITASMADFSRSGSIRGLNCEVFIGRHYLYTLINI